MQLFYEKNTLPHHEPAKATQRFRYKPRLSPSSFFFSHLTFFLPSFPQPPPYQKSTSITALDRNQQIPLESFHDTEEKKSKMVSAILCL